MMGIGRCRISSGKGGSNSGGASARSWSRCWRACRHGARSWALAAGAGRLLHDRRRAVAARGPAGPGGGRSLGRAVALRRDGPRGARRALPANLPSAATAPWHMVVDAVPEPAVVLDGAGYVMHANRMAEDLFGSRRRGGHVASMSRDPELLEAVDQALASGETAAVELHERVPVERRLLATVAPLERSRSGAGRPRAPHLVSRPERAGPARQDARRLRRQRQPRAQDPAGLAQGLRRDAARARPRTTPRRASASSRS